jgi:hypothetical protein
MIIAVSLRNTQAILRAIQLASEAAGTASSVGLPDKHEA